jgi:hypothetical protein
MFYSNSILDLAEKSLQSILADYLELDSVSLSDGSMSALLSSNTLQPFFEKEIFPPGEIVFDVDQPADKVCLFY